MPVLTPSDEKHIWHYSTKLVSLPTPN